LIASYRTDFCALGVLLWPLLNHRDGHERTKKTQKEKSPDYETLKRSTQWVTSGDAHYGFHCNTSTLIQNDILWMAPGDTAPRDTPMDGPKRYPAFRH
jgi:hypothetical protein